MVAPHQVGNVVRSFVRVPGSGSERFAGPAFCDLAKASTLAATVSVPATISVPLPPTTNVPAQSPPIQNNQQRKRPRSKETKKAKESISAPKAKAPHMKPPSAGAPVKTINVILLAVRIPNAEVEKLKEDNEQLRKENEKLKKQLSLFKQLIRNPQRLNSVLRHLEVQEA